MVQASRVLVLIGLPGAGKTTVARHICALVGARHRPIDDYRSRQATAAAIADDLAASAANRPTVFECSGASEDFEPILAHLACRKVRTRVVLLDVSAETALRRAAARVPGRAPKAGRSWHEHVAWVRTRLRLVPTDADIDCTSLDAHRAAAAAVEAWNTAERSDPGAEPSTSPLTFSRLSTWQVCGREYAYRNVWRVSPTAKLPPVVEVGTVAHAALAWLFAPGGQRRELGAFLGRFDSGLPAEAAGAGEATRQWARKLLSDFFVEHYVADSAETLAVESEVGLSLGPAMTLTGRLDRLARNAAGEIEVTEYKLRESRRGSRPRVPELLQPGAYAVAVMSAHALARAFVGIHFLEQRCVDRLLLNQAAAENIRAALRRWIAILQRKGLSARPGHHCQHCGYRLICPDSLSRTAATFDSVAASAREA